MFSYFQFSEVLSSIREHKVRNILTGFGIAWGIFILVVLLSIGEGFQKGVMRMFGEYTANSLWLYSGQTSQNQIGSFHGRSIVFTQQVMEQLVSRFSDEVKVISPEVTLVNTSHVHYEENYNLQTIKGVLPAFFAIKKPTVVLGRLLNERDNQLERNVAVIGSNARKTLFRDVNPIGESIIMSGSWYKVIGVLGEKTILDQQAQNDIYIPYASAQNYLQQGREFNCMVLGLNEGVDVSQFEKKLRVFLGRALDFHTDDNSALYVINFEDQVKSFQKLFGGIKIFLWLVGICLLLVGTVGVGNMMLVIVRERTHELGIRKALGASPRAIFNLIMIESLGVTFLSGIFGLLLALGTVSVANIFVTDLLGEEAVIDHLYFNNYAAIAALLVVIVSGCVAGWIPAQKAMSIQPIDAIRQE
ncbi:MAG: ABC transporter permease [Flavobacteriales bacterium]|nr:ABC transporter permease [Flavobacteriales bacterium]